MDFEKFKQNFTTIEYVEGSNAFGHHPFQLVVINNNGEMEINALVGLRMEQVIRRVKEYLADKAKDIFLTLDLPKGGDIENDFVLALHLLEGQLIETSTIEYDPKDGKIIKMLDNRESSLIAAIAKYFE